MNRIHFCYCFYCVSFIWLSVIPFKRKLKCAISIHSCSSINCEYEIMKEPTSAAATTKIQPFIHLIYIQFDFMVSYAATTT